MGSYFPDSHLLGTQAWRERVERVVLNALAFVCYHLSEKAIHLAFLIENFQVTNREPIPTAALDQDDWKRASRD
jgi:hypothetical protein